MTPALQEAIERLQAMSVERQDAFARLLLREIAADENWIRSTAQKAEWQQKQRQPQENGAPPNGRVAVPEID